MPQAVPSRALLNEDQSYLLLTYTRNTERTRHLKIKLVAFGEARRAAETGIEYLPTYHALHDELHALATGSIIGDHDRWNFGPSFADAGKAVSA